MSIPCVCGCPDALHLNYSDCCINWHSDGCMCFHADDGSDVGTLVVPPWSNNYVGVYAKKYNLEEPA